MHLYLIIILYATKSLVKYITVPTISVMITWSEIYSLIIWFTGSDAIYGFGHETITLVSKVIDIWSCKEKSNRKTIEPWDDTFTETYLIIGNSSPNSRLVIWTCPFV